MGNTVTESMKIGTEIKHGENILEKLEDATLEIELLAKKLGLKEAAIIELIATPIVYELASLHLRAMID